MDNCTGQSEDAIYIIRLVLMNCHMISLNKNQRNTSSVIVWLGRFTARRAIRLDFLINGSMDGYFVGEHVRMTLWNFSVGITQIRIVF